ncbi:YifB family Mg chelatase-like AAA ATPase [Sterolibacterium denitrificans]|nr:YifB family Mg chelatase-like AAA ATPase [Sterolibacterium denitrificans]
MSLAVLRSRAISGMDAPEVIVEVHLAAGLPRFTLVGLPDTEVKEARDRVHAAIQNCRFEFPQRRITVNLAPADLPKESGRFDLPIALGILIATGQLKARDLDAHEFAGELALGGELRPVRGALAMVAAMASQTDATQRSCILPAASAAEAALVRSASILPARSLLEVCAHLAGQQPLTPLGAPAMATTSSEADLTEVKGQQQARRALEVAAAGAHSLLFSGPPGTGKSMLASRLPGILPPLTEAEALASAAVHSLAGRFRVEHWGQRPFRAPHHSASTAALVGGGSVPRPGEISLAHNGVLFLDEFSEFDRRVLEALREPLETGHVCISRAARRADFPARFQLIAAMNPCPCGWLGHANGKCRCTPEQVMKYRGKLSGPLLDRIDLLIEVPALSDDELQSRASSESSATVRQRVMAARERQLERQGKTNALLGSAEIDAYCTPDAAGSHLLRQAISRLSLSARAYHRVLKVARSIADLAGSEQITQAHIAEAIHYRRAAG